MNFSLKNMKFWSLFCVDKNIELKLSTMRLKYKCAHCNAVNLGALNFIRNRESDFDLENGTTQLNLYFECVECKKRNELAFLMGHKEKIDKIVTSAEFFENLQETKKDLKNAEKDMK